MEWNDNRLAIYFFVGLFTLVFMILDYGTPGYWLNIRLSLMQMAFTILLTVEILDRLAEKHQFELYGARPCREIMHNLRNLSNIAHSELVNSGRYDPALKEIGCRSSSKTPIWQYMHNVNSLLFNKYEGLIRAEGKLEPTEDQRKDMKYFCTYSWETLERLEYHINFIMPFFPKNSDLLEKYLRRLRDMKSWSDVVRKGDTDEVYRPVICAYNLLMESESVYSILLRKIGLKQPQQYQELEIRRKAPPP